MKRERIINTGRSGKRNSVIYNITKRTMDNIYISPAEEHPCGETPTLARGVAIIASERVTIY